MAYLKTYENFLKKVWSKLVEPKDSTYFVNWNVKEKEELIKLNINFLGGVANYNSKFANTIITLIKFFDKIVIGYSESRYVLKKYNNKHQHEEVKYFDKFENLLNYLKKLIADEEIIANKQKI